MQTIRKMAVFWLCLCSAYIVFSQNRAAYLATSTNSATIEHKTSRSSTYTIPFKKAGSLLLVNAEIDSKAGVFILDTGAPTLVVNQVRTSSGEIQAKGINGSLSVNDTFIKKFRWNNQEWRNLSGLSVDMQHFNDVSEEGVKGLIGYEILRDYEVVVDPIAQTIVLVSNRKETPYNPDQVLASIPMQQQEHMPVIELSINGKKVLLGIDTGAETNFIDQTLFQNGSIGAAEAAGVIMIKGLGENNEKRESKVRVKNLQIGAITLQDQAFTLKDMSQLFPKNAEGLKVQGIVGSAFLNQFNYSINYRKGVFTLINKL